MATANRSGASLSSVCVAMLRDSRITHIPRHPIGRTGEMGSAIRVDIYLPRIYGGLYVECIRQDSTGSAEAKIAMLCEDIRKHYDLPTIIVVGGLKSSRIYGFAKDRDSCKQSTMNIEEFHRWCIANERETNAVAKPAFNGDQKHLF